MTEKDIRRLLRIICEDLDRRGRRVVRRVMLPSVLGAGMALSGCDERSVPADSGVNDGQGGAEIELGPQPEYMAPDMGAIQPPYMAPDSGAIQPLYMSPDMGAIQPPYMAPDWGMDPLYMAPEVDAGYEPGPQPEYMAPQPEPDPKS